MISTIIGFIIISIGLVVFMIGSRASNKVIALTKNDPDGLTNAESWLNTRQFKKIEKLRKYVAQSDDLELKHSAKIALKCEWQFYVFFFIGIFTILIGANVPNV